MKNYSSGLEKEYKSYRNTLKKIINNTKNLYYKKHIDENVNDFRKIYQIIREATNVQVDNTTSKIDIFNDEGEIFSDNKQLADFCNKFFIEVGKKMAQKINPPRQPFEVGYNNSKSMFLTPVTENQVIIHINSLKNNSSPGLDSISSKLIKMVHIHIIKPLTHIINTIFKTGHVPNYFKTSVVTPIFKAGNKREITNYRPISLINNFGKILEKCIKERLINFFEVCDILSEKQFAFIKNKGTNDAVFHLVSEISRNLNNNRKTIAIFLDLAKAFDTVPHDKLLDILFRYGVRGPVLNVFPSYLNNRTQFLRLIAH